MVPQAISMSEPTPQRPFFLGVDLGGTNIKAGVVDNNGVPLSRVERATEAEKGPEHGIQRICQASRDAVREAGLTLNAIHSVGVGSPGPLDLAAQILINPYNLPGWLNLPLARRVGENLGLPGVLQNDANAAAFGEYWAGVGRGKQSLVQFTLGTGIGCGIVIDGELYRGVDGCAGDIGHIRVEEFGPTCACGNTGCLEAFAGGAALGRDATAAARSGRSEVLAAMLAERPDLSAADVGLAVAQGDPVAVQLIRDSGRRVGQVLASLVSFFNPGLIVIGGRVTGLGHALLAEVRGVTYRRSLPLATGNLPIVLSELGDEGGVIGAARLISTSVYAP